MTTQYPHLLWLLLRLVVLGGWTLWAVRHRSQTVIMLWAIAVGVEIGLDLPRLAPLMHVLSDLFLRLMRVIVAPLVIGSLLTSITSQRDAGGLRRIGIKTFIYFEVVTTLALLIGFAAMDLSWRVKPPHTDGAVTSRATGQQMLLAPSNKDDASSLHRVLTELVPDNVIKALYEDNLLGLAVLSILFGAALRHLPSEKRTHVVNVLETFTETIHTLTRIVMTTAPLGVAASIAYTIATSGMALVMELARVLTVLYLGAMAFIVFVLIPVVLLAHLPLRRFLNAVAEPASIAFSTTSSAAALPTAIQSMEAFGAQTTVVSFVFPLGYSFNLAGTSLYLSMALLYLARASGHPLTFRIQIEMLLVLMLTSKGVAAVPRSALIVLLTTVSILRMPEAPLFMLLSIDPFADMVRTMLNVTGNCLAVAVIDTWSKKRDHKTIDTSVAVT